MSNATDAAAAAPPTQYFRSDHAETYRTNANFVYSDENTAPVLRLLDAKPGDKILDLGCGSGELTLKLLPLVGPTGRIVGVDASADMIDKARALAERHRAQEPATATAVGTAVAGDGFEAHVADGQQLTQWLESSGNAGAFDKVFSSAAIHWMNRDPPAVARGMRAALRTGGLLAIEFGGQGNVEAVRRRLWQQLERRGVDPSQHDPWYFPSAEEYTQVLQQAGFDVLSAELVVRPTPLPNGLRSWLQTFGGPFLNALPDDAREAVASEVEKDIIAVARGQEPQHTAGEDPDYAESWYDASRDAWTARYIRIRVKAVAR